MDEDILSDVVPSNIVSRQVFSIPYKQSLLLTRNSVKPSQGVDGESEYDNDAMEEDELMSEAEDIQVHTCSVKSMA